MHRGSFEVFDAIVSACQDLRPRCRIVWRCQNLYPLWKHFDADVVKAMVVPVDTVSNSDHALAISESVLSREEFDKLWTTVVGGDAPADDWMLIASEGPAVFTQRLDYRLMKFKALTSSMDPADVARGVRRAIKAAEDPLAVAEADSDSVLSKFLGCELLYVHPSTLQCYVPYPYIAGELRDYVEDQSQDRSVFTKLRSFFS